MAVIVLGSLLYVELWVNARLSAAIAEADRTDPGWRLDDLDAARDIPPDGENSAIVVAEVARQLPADWLRADWARASGDEEAARRYELIDETARLDPNRSIDEPTWAALHFVLECLDEAVDLARDLAELPSGGTALVRTLNPLDTPLPHTQVTRQVARLLSLDVQARNLRDDADGAIASCRALLNAGRAIGDEPTAISMLVRLAIDGMAVDAVERALAQGEPSDLDCGKLWDLLADEEDYPHLRVAYRGERAAYAVLIERLASGELSFDTSDASGSARPRAPSLRGQWLCRESESIGLEIFRDAIALSDTPIEDHLAGIAVLDEKIREVPTWRAPLIRLLPAIDLIAHLHSRTKADLRCTLAAVAAERYRLAQGAFPRSLDALVPEYLPAVPVDPFGGGPIRLIRRDDGVTIYSLGLDGKDNAGAVRRSYRPTDRDFDFGFRLYDVDARARPADPPRLLDDIPPRPLDSPPD